MKITRKMSTTITASDWLEHFERNRIDRMHIPWERGLHIETSLRSALICSLQRFQVGETGEGRHLKACAAQTGDPVYEKAIDLFIKEEQEHARLLARVLQMLDAPLLQGHWSDACFIVLRRMSALRMELMVLLMAEIIAKRYYRAVYEASDDPVLRSLCAQILRDEVSHVAFHCDYLRGAFTALSAPQRWLVQQAWKSLFRLVCYLLVWDHREFLRASKLSRSAFVRDCERLFNYHSNFIFETTGRRPIVDCVKMPGA